MKKSLIFGVISLFSGICLSAGTFVATGFDYKKLALDQNVERIEEQLDDSISSIKFDTTVANVKLKTHNENYTLLEYYKSDYFTPSYTLVDGVLDFEVDYKFHWSVIFDWWNFSREYITITLPHDTDLELIEVKATSGSFRVDDINFKEGDISLTSGDVKIYNAVSEKLKVSCTTGSVRLNSVKSDDISVSITTGDSYLKYVEANNLNIKGTTGEIEINNSQVTHASLATTSGEIDVNNSVFDVIKAECRTGEIDFDRVEASIIDTSTTSGEIDLQIVGAKSDYNIDVSVSSGSCNVSNYFNASNTKSVKARSTTGSIKIKWTN